MTFWKIPSIKNVNVEFLCGLPNSCEGGFPPPNESHEYPLPQPDLSARTLLNTYLKASYNNKIFGSYFVCQMFFADVSAVIIYMMNLFHPQIKNNFLSHVELFIHLDSLGVSWQIL